MADARVATAKRFNMRLSLAFAVAFAGVMLLPYPWSPLLVFVPACLCSVPFKELRRVWRGEPCG